MKILHEQCDRNGGDKRRVWKHLEWHEEGRLELKKGQREEFQEQLKQAVCQTEGQDEKKHREICKVSSTRKRCRPWYSYWQQEEQEQRERLRETKGRAKRLREDREQEMAEGELEGWAFQIALSRGNYLGGSLSA